MWIHPKDQVNYENEKFEVEAVSGLYSTGMVLVVLVNSKSQEKKTFSLTEFNALHEQGKVKVTQPKPRSLRSY